VRHVIGEPARAFRQDLRLVGAGFFFELAQRRLARTFALVDAALRHLPVVAGGVDAPADEHQVAAVEQHDAHSGAIALGADRGDGLVHFAAPCCSLGLAASALAGASTSPFPSSVLAQAATRSTVTG
jgi:hypothetical protein